MVAGDARGEVFGVPTRPNCSLRTISVPFLDRMRSPVCCQKCRILGALLCRQHPRAQGGTIDADHLAQHRVFVAERGRRERRGGMHRAAAATRNPDIAP